MADKSIKYILGVLENVPTKVGKFIIPADFVVMDMEEDPKIPILLGRSFLVTVGVVIDMKNGKIKVEVNDESIVFDVYKMIKTSPPIEVCERINSIDITDDCVNDVVHEYIGKDPLSNLMSQGAIEKHSNKEVLDCVSVLELAPSTYPYRYQRFEPLRKEDDPKPSSPSEAPNLELKPLPSTLSTHFLIQILIFL